MIDQIGFLTRSEGRSRISRLTTMLSLLCVALGMLAGCGETAGNEEDRRFANDPSGDMRPTGEVQETRVPLATPTVQPLPSPETLLRARGAPATVYALVNGSIQSVNATGTGTSTRTIAPPPDTRFIAIDSSPSGNRVAAVTVPATDASSRSSVDVHIFDSEGARLETWTGVLAPRDTPSTPDSGAVVQAGAAVMLDWGAQGDRLVVASAEGQLASITLGEGVESIETPAVVAAIGDVEWSPRGDRIAVLGTGEDGGTRIGLIDPTAPGPEFLVVAPIEETGEGEQIRGFTWLPDGSGFVFLGGNGEDAGGQLFLVDLETMTQRLVATAGRGGPSATINSFSVSPDGKAVAYTIVVLDAGTPRFNSLWVRSLRDKRGLPMPVGDVVDVNALWWVDDGVVWSQTVQEGDAVQESFIQLPPGGDPSVIHAIEVGTQTTGAAATPVATPAATPAATPLAATPVG
ncbi:MAG TPA: hypothetical protein VGR08_06515 [Thermomicrobiales bacterium]|nr:hypothetical protein [Thermomicrobiales bacterium]